MSLSEDIRKKMCRCMCNHYNRDCLRERREYHQCITFELTADAIAKDKTIYHGFLAKAARMLSKGKKK